MSQNIQLQQVMVDGMVIKVRRHNIRCRIICRMLHRSKGINILPQGKYDNSSRMLSGTSSDSGTSLHDPVNFADTLSRTPLLIIIAHKSKCRLIRQRTDGSGTVSLPVTENNLRIFVGITLVVTGEIQVNIRLLISLKSEESLKRNVKSILYQLLATDRAKLIRHVPSAASRECTHFLGIKITVMTGFTIIMGTQRIDLRNSRHSSHEGRTYRATGTHQITILVGLPNQLLCNNIHYGKSVGNNGIQLPLQTLRNHLRQFLSIHLMGAVVADISQHLVRIRNHRRTLIRPHRCDLLHPVRDHIGIVDYNLMSLGRSQIFEFLQHLFRSTKIQRCLFVRISESLSRHNNPPVYLILRIQEMHITGSHYRLPKLLAQTDNFPVNLL